MSIHELDQLEDPANLSGHKRMWRLQRGVWLLMLVTLLLALGGLFGSGPLSTGEREAGDGALRVQYRRFWRVKSPTTLQVHIRSPEVRV